MNELIHQDVISDDTKALLAQAAKSASESEVSSIPFMSIKGKKFSVGDDKLGSTLDCVIIADMFDHAYYDRDYDPDAQIPPACFAIGNNELTMAPDTSLVPVVQNEVCHSCPQNQFGSSKNGKGKACRNGRRLLLASMIGSDINFADLAIINIPPTSLKTYSRYIKSMYSVYKVPIWASVTRLSFDDDSAWPSIVLNRLGPVKNNDLETIISNIDYYNTTISVPYDASSYEPPDVTSKKSKMS